MGNTVSAIVMICCFAGKYGVLGLKLEHLERKAIQIGLASAHSRAIACGTCEQAAAMQIGHLLDLGHRKIGFIMDCSKVCPSTQRDTLGIGKY